MNETPRADSLQDQKSDTLAFIQMVKKTLPNSLMRVGCGEMYTRVTRLYDDLISAVEETEETPDYPNIQDLAAGNVPVWLSERAYRLQSAKPVARNLSQDMYAEIVADATPYILAMAAGTLVCENPTHIHTFTPVGSSEYCEIALP